MLEPLTLGPGQPFKCATVDNNGTPVTQKERILQVNRDAPTHMGKIHSDLAGFTWTCDENGSPTTCEEPVVLEEPKDPDFAPASAEVHHVVPMKDKRSCPWGTNSNKNAAVISRKLNQYFSNNDPPANEVDKLNKTTAYVP